MRNLFALLVGGLSLASASTALAQDWSALQAQDLRLARVADRIQSANAALCVEQMPVTGLILHSADQYRAGAAEGRFAQGRIAVAAVVPGSPAEAAGLRADDGLVAIGGTPTATLVAEGERRLREAAFSLVAAQSPDAPLALRVARGGAERDVIVQPLAGCRSLVEILTGDAPDARSDGRVIQLRYGFAAALDDTQLAVVFAHELAHTVLAHQRRKEAAGIDVGLLATVGRNFDVNRRAEIEADRLSLHLLANAGYDPAEAATLWRRTDVTVLQGAASAIYPSNERRAELLDREIALYLPLRRGPTWPGHLLALRNRPF